VNRELAESFGMKQPRGAVVLRVLPDSPAAKAGFKVGDVVVEFDGKKIYRSSDLPLAVGQADIGSKSTVTVIREGKSKTLKVTIAELPPEEELAEAQPSQPGKAKTDKLGLGVETLSSEQREQMELGKRGVIVRNVEAGPARSAGIRPGDILLVINNQDITSAEQFAKLVKDLPAGKSVPVLIQRGDSPVFLPLKIPD
jgi:serine protease Do